MIFLDYLGHKYVFNWARNRCIRVIWLLIKNIIFVKMQKKTFGPQVDPQALLLLSPAYRFDCPEARPWPWPPLIECSCATVGPAAAGSLVGSPLVCSCQGLPAAQPCASWLPTHPAPCGSPWEQPHLIFHQHNSIYCQWDPSHAYIYAYVKNYIGYALSDQVQEKSEVAA